MSFDSSLCQRQRNCTRYSSCQRRLLRGLPRGWAWRTHRVGAMRPPASLWVVR